LRQNLGEADVFVDVAGPLLALLAGPLLALPAGPRRLAGAKDHMATVQLDGAGEGVAWGDGIGVQIHDSLFYCHCKAGGEKGKGFGQ
jgi:hypothetical protein